MQSGATTNSSSADSEDGQQRTHGDCNYQSTILRTRPRLRKRLLKSAECKFCSRSGLPCPGETKEKVSLKKRARSKRSKTNGTDLGVTPRKKRGRPAKTNGKANAVAQQERQSGKGKQNRNTNFVAGSGLLPVSKSSICHHQLDTVFSGTFPTGSQKRPIESRFCETGCEIGCVAPRCCNSQRVHLRDAKADFQMSELKSWRSPPIAAKNEESGVIKERHLVVELCDIAKVQRVADGVLSLKDNVRLDCQTVIQLGSNSISPGSIHANQLMSLSSPADETFVLSQVTDTVVSSYEETVESSSGSVERLTSNTPSGSVFPLVSNSMADHSFCGLTSLKDEGSCETEIECEDLCPCLPPLDEVTVSETAKNEASPIKGLAKDEDGKVECNPDSCQRTNFYLHQSCARTHIQWPFKKRASSNSLVDGQRKNENSGTSMEDIRTKEDNSILPKMFSMGEDSSQSFLDRTPLPCEDPASANVGFRSNFSSGSSPKVFSGDCDEGGVLYRQEKKDVTMQDEDLNGQQILIPMTAKNPFTKCNKLPCEESQSITFGSGNLLYHQRVPFVSQPNSMESRWEVLENVLLSKHFSDDDWSSLYSEDGLMDNMPICNGKIMCEVQHDQENSSQCLPSNNKASTRVINVCEKDAVFLDVILDDPDLFGNIFRDRPVTEGSNIRDHVLEPQMVINRHELALAKKLSFPKFSVQQPKKKALDNWIQSVVESVPLKQSFGWDVSVQSEQRCHPHDQLTKAGVDPSTQKDLYAFQPGISRCRTITESARVLLENGKVEGALAILKGDVQQRRNLLTRLAQATAEQGTYQETLQVLMGMPGLLDSTAPTDVDQYVTIYNQHLKTFLEKQSLEEASSTVEFMRLRGLLVEPNLLRKLICLLGKHKSWHRARLHFKRSLHSGCYPTLASQLSDPSPLLALPCSLSQVEMVLAFEMFLVLHAGPLQIVSQPPPSLQFVVRRTTDTSVLKDSEYQAACSWLMCAAKIPNPKLVLRYTGVNAQREQLYSLEALSAQRWLLHNLGWASTLWSSPC